MFKLEHIKFLDVLSIDYLEIYKGEVTCIIGESGAGKSTLAKLLNKMITPNSGTITYDDKDLKQYNTIELRREVLMLSQTPLIFEGSIEDNLQIGLEFSGEKLATKNEMMTQLKNMGLNKNLEDNVMNLSGGEKQRIALARVALMSGNVYILDEPTSALDDKTEMNVVKLFLEDAKKRGKTVIIITHSESLANMFGDRVIEIKRGEIYD